MKAEQGPLRITVVDDEENIRHYLQLLLQHEGFEVIVASNAEEALERLSMYPSDIILCDIRMPGKMDGLGLLKAVQEQPHLGEVVMMSAYGSRDTALEAVRLGAYDYIDKPIQRDDLILTLRKLLERERLRRENQQLRAALAMPHEDEGIVASSPAMTRVLDVARKVATFPSTVLVTGESGTGKELLARAVHRWSDRGGKPFVAVNCGSIPENLLESELFGYARGAFTGAHRDREGLFESANGGSLFLDEVGELPLAIQVKLLRVLQENVIRRLGETHTRDIDVRLIAATNRDLAQEVEVGRFRQDLFYRLHVVSLELPPLRDRPEDVPALLDTYIQRFNARFGTKIQGVSVEAMRCLSAYHWPGNIRELRNVVERAIVLEESDELTLDVLPPELTTPQLPSALPALAKDEFSIKKASRLLERTLISRALEHTGGNRSAAARLLEISHRALLYKIKQYELS